MHLHRQVPIAAPPAAVWRCLVEADLRKRWMGRLVSEEIDDADRKGVGATATVRLRQNNKVVTYRSTIIDWEPGRKLSVGITGGDLPKDLAMGVIYDLLPGDAADTTVLDYHFHMPIRGFFMRLLLTPAIRMGLGKAIDPDLARLRALAESLANEGEGT